MSIIKSSKKTVSSHHSNHHHQHQQDQLRKTIKLTRPMFLNIGYHRFQVILIAFILNLQSIENRTTSANETVPVDQYFSSSSSSSSSESETHRRLKRALNEENLQDALKSFLETWDSHHDHRSKVNLDSLSASIASQSADASASSSSEPGLKQQTDGSSSDLIANAFARRNCSSCLQLDDAKQRRIRSIKFQILSQLGFKDEPKTNLTIQGNLDAPPLLEIKKLAKQIERSTASNGVYPGEERMSSDQAYSSTDDYDGDSEDFYVNTNKAISFAVKPPENWQFLKGIKSQYFKFSPNVINSHLSQAHLWVYIQPKQQQNGENRPTNATIVVYEVRKSREPVSLMSIRSKKLTVDGKKGRWVTLDIRKLVQEWFRSPNGNLGLVIHAYDDKGRSVYVSNPYDGEDTSQKTFIELSTKTKKSNRVRRETGIKCEEGSKEINCCLHPLTVDFEEFGWDWIIAPKRYEANFCSGECPYMFLQDNNHAHLVQQANPAMSTGPCCTPRKMSSISMLYYDDNNQIIYGTLKAMKAERCGCA